MITRIYTIPLRKEFQKAAFKFRTNKAIRALKEFVVKHMKTENVVIGEELNLHLWAQGITNPPAKVKVEITLEEKDGKKEAFVNLVGFKKTVVESKKRNILQKQGVKDKLAQAVETLKGKTEAKVEEDAKEETAEKVKKPKAKKKAEEVSKEA
jgi:large subunit ribosomal protein L31e